MAGGFCGGFGLGCCRHLEFFEARGSHTPDEHADETFDRVMRRISEGERIENPAGYCYGVARFVWKEASRRRSREPVELDENAAIPAIVGSSQRGRGDSAKPTTISVMTPAAIAASASNRPARGTRAGLFVATRNL